MGLGGLEYEVPQKLTHFLQCTHILHNFWTSTHRGEASPLPPLVAPLLGSERTLDGQDELRDDGQDLVGAVIQQIMNSAHCKHVIREIGLDQAVEEHR